MWLPLALIYSPTLAGVLLASYLLGAIPFGFVLGKAFKGVDLRRVGSGNIGATNAIRNIGKPLGLTAFFLDWGKGFAAAYWLAPMAGAEDLGLVQVMCGSLAVVGHCFPVYLGFRGGKGVATASGAIIAMDPLVFLAGGIVWLVALFTSRYVSVASIAMGITFPLAALWRGGRAGWPLVLGCAALALLILVRHRGNMRRLRAGTESKIGQKDIEPVSEQGNTNDQV